VGREANTAQSCDDGMVAITETVLPHCTSEEIFWIRNWVVLLSSVCSMTREPICHTNKRALEPQAPRVSMQRGEKRKEEVSVEYFFSFADSAEFTSWLEPSEEVDKLEGARYSKVAKERYQGINDILTFSHHHDIHLQALKQQGHLQTPMHEELFH